MVRLRRLRDALHGIRRILDQRRRYRAAGYPVREIGQRGRRLALIFAALVRQRRLAALRAPRRWRRRPTWTNRAEHGAWRTMVRTMMEDDPEMFFEHFRMTPQVFNELLARLTPYLQKRPMHMYLPPGERLALTLHYLASGSFQKFAGSSFCVPPSTVCTVIKETCEVLWEQLLEECFPPLTEERLEGIMDGFWQNWNFPNAMDGKHCILQNFANADADWLNYKGDFSMVLLGMCDSKYKFTYVSIGGRGRRHDAGLWRECDLHHALVNGELPLPAPRLLPGGWVATPPTIIADGAFPLGPNLMKPFRRPQLLSPADHIFNYRISRARQTIENAFGILSARWRVLRRTFIAKEATARAIIQACVVLHNYLILNQENVPPHQYWYAPPNIRDVTGIAEHQLPPVRFDVQEELDDGDLIREHLVDYFVGPGSVPWQWQHMNG
ncbi:Putative nuclease [Frankliniella fusca]|uniref:Nuclease n=1 Tax=Frankliniella fusca TaxID=407009 RepID=A0AAE1LVN5_9NEOP|nr:Putative nuclease [Frankliniella fusca]